MTHTPRRNNELGAAGRNVARNVVQLRKVRGLTATGLAMRMRELGRIIDNTGVGRIEKGERRVDADDLVILAQALEVRPDQLLSELVTKTEFVVSIVPDCSAGTP